MKYILFYLSLGLFFLFPSPALAALKSDVDLSQGKVHIEYSSDNQDQEPVTEERISTFTSEIAINNDASIEIKETLQYETPSAKHGIFRYIPEEYKENGQTYVSKVSNIRVSDDKSTSIPFSKQKENGNVVLKIGDANRTFSGKQTYVISYTVQNALKRFSDHDELYWDITGEGWNYPISQTTAVIKSPYAPITQVACYSGEVGNNDELCKATNTSNEAQFTYSQTIMYGQNLTVVVGLTQNGAITFPAAVVKPKISGGIIAGILLVPFGIMFLLWYFKGRDYVFISPNIYDLDETKPKKLKPLFGWRRRPFVYEPFKTITPAEAGTVLDEKTDNRDIIAEIIDLARKRYLSIKAEEKKGFLGIGGGTEYSFTQLKTETTNLPEYQKYLFEKLFKIGTEVKLSDLKGTFYTHMQKTRSMIYEEVTKKNLFTHNPTSVRGIYILVGACLFILAAIILSFLSKQGEIQSPEYFLTIIPSLLGTVLLANNMVQKSAVGTNLSLQAKGLRDMIKVGKWRQEIAEKNLFIEEVLPFAIAFGVVDQLAKAMGELNIPNPSYLNSAMLTNMSVNSFVNSFNTQAISNLSYNPASSSRSGGSGFSGGFSGGGGGGGGGGSW